MVFSKRSDFKFCLLIFLFLSGCATSSFKLIKQHELAAELKVTPDRVLLECEFQNNDNSDNDYGFMMHVLDDQNTVLSIVQTNVIDKVSCLKRLEKIGKILKTGRVIYIGGMGNLSKPRIQETDVYTFPRLGTFSGNGRSAQFMVIGNEQGLCYDAYSGDEEPCPREPVFSLKNLN